MLYDSNLSTHVYSAWRRRRITTCPRTQSLRQALTRSMPIILINLLLNVRHEKVSGKQPQWTPLKTQVHTVVASQIGLGTEQEHTCTYACIHVFMGQKNSNNLSVTSRGVLLRQCWVPVRDKLGPPWVCSGVSRRSVSGELLRTPHTFSPEPSTLPVLHPCYALVCVYLRFFLLALYSGLNLLTLIYFICFNILSSVPSEIHLSCLT